MKKFFLISIAIYLFFLALIGIIFCSLSFIGLNARPEALPSNFKPFYVLLIWLPFIGWLIATGIGLLLKRNWGRYSILIMSGFAILIGAILCLTFSFMPLQPGGMATETSWLGFKAFAIGITIILLIIFPVIYGIFFTRSAVKELFRGKAGGENNSPRPVGISILAIFQLINGIWSIFMGIFPMYPSLPLCGNIMLSGLALQIYFLILGLLTLYLAYGFWRLQKVAWLASIVLSCFGLGMGIINFFTLDIRIYDKLMPEGYPNPLNPFFYKMVVVFGIIVSLLIMFYVISKKAAFFGDKSKAEKQLSVQG